MSTENETPEGEEVETSEVTDEGLFDAISEGIDEITPENKDDTSTTEDDDSASTDAESDGAAAGSESAEDDSGTDDAADDEEDTSGRETSDEDAGADDKKTGKDEDGDGASEAAGEDRDGKDKGDDTAGTPDPINDPIPESTNEKTAERIQSLISIAKENTAAVEQRDELYTAIEQTGADAEQYSATLGFLQLYNSEDPKERGQALAVARGIVKELALELGEGRSVVDLSEHDDLRAEVEAETLTEERALEIAADREARKLADARAEAKRTKDSEQSTTQQLVEQGKTELDTLGKTLAANDADYARLHPMYVSLLRPVLKRTHPTEWADTARDMYAQVKAMNPAPASGNETPANDKKKDEKPQPLRHKQPAGGGSTEMEAEDSDALDAVNKALAGV